MTSLGIAAGRTPGEEAANHVHEQSLKAEFGKKVALGSGWSIGAAIVFGAYDILRHDPKDAFPLLMTWGPKAIGSILVVYVVYDLFKMALNMVNRLVHSVEKLAVAQERAADKDDRQVQEMQTLTSYTAQQSERMHEKIGGMAGSLLEINRKLDDLGREKQVNL